MGRLAIIGAVAMTLSVWSPEPVRADRRHGRLVEKATYGKYYKDALAKKPNGRGSCYWALRRLGVRYSRVRRRKIRNAVMVRGPIGGVRYVTWPKKKRLVLDCSLVVSLAAAGPTLRAHGITEVSYSSAYQIRNIMGTGRLSMHAYGLAIDLHTFNGDKIDLLSIEHDYEQGLGNDADCVGKPLTKAGAVLRRIDCWMSRSRLFRLVIGPDYNISHHNHFHVEVRPWRKRREVPELLRKLRRKRRSARRW
jgi:hypothetical protein